MLWDKIDQKLHIFDQTLGFLSKFLDAVELLSGMLFEDVDVKILNADFIGGGKALSVVNSEESWSWSLKVHRGARWHLMNLSILI